MLIRPAQKKDLVTCARLFHVPEVREANGEFLTPDFLAHYLDDKYFLVGELAGEVCGALFGEPLRARGVMLLNFAVAEPHRGQGLGSALLNKFEANAKHDQREWILIYAPLHNERTLKFYQKRSYSRGDRLVEYLKLIDSPDLKSIYKI